MSETFLLKNIFCPPLIDHLGLMAKRGYVDFDVDGFKADVLPKLEPLSLTERASCVNEAFGKQFPTDFTKTAPMLIKAFDSQGFHPEIVKYEEFRYMPFGLYVAEHGLDHFDESMAVLYELTKRFTSEFPIRPFIERHPDRAMEQLIAWTEDESEHVRRLVSEGTRTRLPWASRLPEFQKDPSPVLGLLERLKQDESRYVQRSVANNLNDIAKDHPQTVVSNLKKWSKIDDPGTNWIIKHASRTLVKAGHTEALILLGYNPEAEVSLTGLNCSEKVQFGKRLEFSFDLKNEGKESESIVVDFIIHFMKANGKLAPKVFKLIDKKLAPGEDVHFEKVHPIKAISTRAYYPGKQRLEVMVNGAVKAQAEFELLMD